MERSILVGVDGSEAGLRAVDWGAREAHRRGLGLVLLCASAMPLGATVWVWPEQEVRKEAARALREARERARTVAPDVATTTTMIDDAPAAALTRSSEYEAMVVVGLRGRGGFPGMKIGSVAYHVAAHSPAPVVVVGPEPAVDANPEVVVGVDGSTNADTALAAAFDTAALTGTRVRAVWAWSAPALRSSTLAPYSEAISHSAESELAQVLQPWRAKYPDVQVVGGSVEAQPVLALIRAAGEARLVVVGARGMRGLPRMALGGVAHGLLHHAPCPVMIVH